MLGWNRGSASLGLEPAEGGVEPIQCLIRQMAHLPQGMTGRDPVFCGDVGKQGTGAFLLAAHPSEKAALKELLSTLDLNGVLIQADALHTAQASFTGAWSRGPTSC